MIVPNPPTLTKPTDRSEDDGDLRGDDGWRHCRRTTSSPCSAESRAQGFRLLDTLADEYASGVNRFAKPGEALFGVYAGATLVAIGGLNRDPYGQDAAQGRVRHVYVLDAWRRQGVGKRLMQAIVDGAAARSRLLTLRTFSADADRFYRAVGFRPASELEQATHCLVLSPAWAAKRACPLWGRLAACAMISAQ